MMSHGNLQTLVQGLCLFPKKNKDSEASRRSINDPLLLILGLCYTVSPVPEQFEPFLHYCTTWSLTRGCGRSIWRTIGSRLQSLSSPLVTPVNSPSFYSGVEHQSAGVTHFLPTFLRFQRCLSLALRSVAQFLLSSSRRRRLLELYAQAQRRKKKNIYKFSMGRLQNH